MEILETFFGHPLHVGNTIQNQSHILSNPVKEKVLLQNQSQTTLSDF